MPFHVLLPTISNDFGMKTVAIRSDHCQTNRVNHWKRVISKSANNYKLNIVLIKSTISLNKANLKLLRFWNYH